MGLFSLFKQPLYQKNIYKWTEYIKGFIDESNMKNIIYQFILKDNLDYDKYMSNNYANEIVQEYRSINDYIFL